MRRVAQASIVRAGGASIASGDIGEALDDMLFAGGKLNVRLLGGTQRTQAQYALRFRRLMSRQSACGGG